MQVKRASDKTMSDGAGGLGKIFCGAAVCGLGEIILCWAARRWDLAEILRGAIGLLQSLDLASAKPTVIPSV